ncbi:LysM peptidoglycan-binding domain-containing protein [Pseudomonas sp. G11-1]|uniref:LysM peptidoglycan-binding domain-containing protein n=1 Tax=Halopseudomonas bauzanensis TaxID=653930 RepID=A0A4U0YLI6_9GAMM|nr:MULTISPECIES: peptidoglycan DD-metalloendopeptidase family protein [Halopseudomonas]MCO5784980.1 LysM peptidoglycan-binding domain-containing protein [Pseudomonas sp. G11-1]MCO5788917.1 LysM peptidoglycan-binding domain-containing protein [Pseudomonas sp. G11-2]TKA91026.1 LysM peptidoglycan-binding domain-containing protein [Halopseudomonas bauzanensis]WGK63276.1 peptidoglycan DD-metalloendopeptidase family protein [Halopseudomonas sp. SMJS2]
MTVRQWSYSSIALPAVLLLASLLSACAGPSGGVPVDDRSRGSSRAEQVTSGSHVVQRGETLYQIAFRYGWDWKALAANNNLRQPFTIYPGQRISLETRSSAVARAPTRTPPAASRPTSSPPVRSTPAPAPAPVKSGAEKQTVTNKPASTPAPAALTGWQWPAQGPLIARFQSNASLNKGIDIAGQLGQPVFAAANGSVVYAGRGLIGYGDMIIIKHDDDFLSAYAHNSRLLVKEGEQVRVGQKIAEMGSSGTDRVKLHFEIRRRGQPVDPLGYLPKL